MHRVRSLNELPVALPQARVTERVQHRQVNAELLNLGLDRLGDASRGRVVVEEGARQRHRLLVHARDLQQRRRRPRRRGGEIESIALRALLPTVASPASECPPSRGHVAARCTTARISRGIPERRATAIRTAPTESASCQEVDTRTDPNRGKPLPC